MKLGSLFAGIGGFDLAARWMGWETAWYSEIDPYASAVMAKQFPGVPNLGDITKLETAAPVDILCGGFPCQDISLAGKGAGIGGARSGLWKEYARLIDRLRPRYVVAENVSALRSRGLDVVLKDFCALGYDAEWHCIPASAVGAPHRRDRIWIIAYPHADDTGLERWLRTELSERAGEQPIGSVGAFMADPSRELSYGRGDFGQRRRDEYPNSRKDVAHPAGDGRGQGVENDGGSTEGTGSRSECGPGCSGEDVADSDCGFAQSHGATGKVVRPSREDEGAREERQRIRDAVDGGSADVADAECRRLPSEHQHHHAEPDHARACGPRDARRWWSVEPDVGRVANGVPSRVDRLRCLGNAIVPQVAYKIFQAIEKFDLVYR